jgi:hypothetical protein
MWRGVAVDSNRNLSNYDMVLGAGDDEFPDLTLGCETPSDIAGREVVGRCIEVEAKGIKNPIVR